MISFSRLLSIASIRRELRFCLKHIDGLHTSLPSYVWFSLIVPQFVKSMPMDLTKKVINFFKKIYFFCQIKFSMIVGTFQNE